MVDSDFEVVWPLGKQASFTNLAQSEVRSVLPDLNDATVGFLWNYTRKGDVMFRIMKDRLRQDYPGISFVDYDRFGNIHGVNETEVVAALPRLLREYKVDVAVVGIGG